MKKRNIALAIVFTIITFGIYGIYWFVCLTNDSNRMNSAEATAWAEWPFYSRLSLSASTAFTGHINSGKKWEIRGRYTWFSTCSDSGS